MSDNLSGSDIVCISDLFWDEHWSSEQQLMSRFASICRVIYVERPVSIFSFFTGISDSSVTRQFLRWLRGGIRKEGNNLFIITPPPFFPFRYHPIINKANQRIRNQSINRALRKIGSRKPIILWIYEPDAALAIGAFKENLSIYHCADDWRSQSHWWNAKRHLKALEDTLVRNTDVVFTVSRRLLQDKMPLARSIFLVPNGVSLTDFSGSLQPPMELERISRPIIGCSAVFNDRYDYDLLRQAASTNPSFSFVFVGKLMVSSKKIARLKAMKNVHFLGQKDRRKLGNYISSFDVCLIPYKRTQFNDSAFPLKLMEYFFYRKPVVSLRIKSIEEFSELAYLYDDNEGFENALVGAVGENNSKKKEERYLIAASNTWEIRVQEVSVLVKEILQKKSSDSL